MPDAAPNPSPKAAPGTGSRTLRNTALVLTARVLSRAIALFTVILTQRHLGPDDYGRFATLATYTSLVTVVVDLGFNTLYVREAAREPAEAGRYLGNMVVTRLLMSVAGFAVLALALILPGLDYLLVPGFVMMLLASLSQLLRQTFYAFQRVGYEAVAIVLESAVLLGLTLTGIRAGGGPAWFAWAYAATYGFSCVFITAVIAARGLVRLRPAFEPALVRRWLVASLPLALTFVVTTLYFKMDVPILQAVRGYTEVGWYTSAYKPFEALLFVPITMLNVVFPVLAIHHRQSPERLVPALEHFYRGLLLIGWPLTVGTVLLAHGLTRLLHLFDQAEAALAILGLGIVLMFVNNTFIGALNSIDRQAAFTRASLVTLAVNVVLNIALIPPFGYVGASWATVLSEAALLVAGWALTRHHLAAIPMFRLGWRTLLAGVVMGAALIPFRGVEGWAVIAVVAGGAAVFAAAAVLLRAVDRADLALLRSASPV